MRGRVFYDGSCFRHAEPELSTATFAVTQVNADGEVEAVLQGTVPRGLPQTSQSAENSGRTAAVQLLDGAAVLYGDCKAVVDAARLPPWKAAHHRRMYAGTRRLADKCEFSKHVNDQKVKAHRKLADAIDADEAWEITGNDHADRNAVAAQALHPRPTGWQAEEQRKQDDKLEQVCRVLGAVPRLWPKADRTTARGNEGKRNGRRTCAAVGADTPHQWEARDSNWRCVVCFSGARDRQSIFARKREECPGISQCTAAIVAHPQGHVLATAADKYGHPVLICLRCGCWSAKRPRKLAAPCRGDAQRNTEGYQALKRVDRGMHPQHQRGALQYAAVRVEQDTRAIASRAFSQCFATPPLRKAAQATVCPAAVADRTPTGPRGVSPGNLEVLRENAPVLQRPKLAPPQAVPADQLDGNAVAMDKLRALPNGEALLRRMRARASTATRHAEGRSSSFADAAVAEGSRSRLPATAAAVTGTSCSSSSAAESHAQCPLATRANTAGGNSSTSSSFAVVAR